MYCDASEPLGSLMKCGEGVAMDADGLVLPGGQAYLNKTKRDAHCLGMLISRLLRQDLAGAEVQKSRRAVQDVFLIS